MVERRRRTQKPPNDPLAWVDKETSSATDTKIDTLQADAIPEQSVSEVPAVAEVSKTNFLNGEDKMAEEQKGQHATIAELDKLIAAVKAGNQGDRLALPEIAGENGLLIKKINELVHNMQVNSLLPHLLEGVSTCVQLADENYNIIYMNPALIEMFNTAETDIRKDLPQFNKNTLMGSNMDIFHKHPAHQRKMMDGLRGKATAEINLGGRTFSLSATALLDKDGKRTNTIIEWSDVTAFKQVTDVLFSVANGDLTHDLTVCSEEGTVKKLHESVFLLKENIGRMVSDADILSVAAIDGRLATRADATKHQGDFRKIVEGVNDTLDAVIGPLNVAADYVDKISQGNIPAKITDTYNGDFNVLKNNLNTCIDAVNALVSDANILSVAAVEGRLATRADATKHQGDFRKIVVGVNDTLDAVIGPLNVAADYVDKISQGNIPAKITDTYNGDFNVLKNNLNTCIDAVNALVSDANILSVAAVEGRLATRADATKHQGDFRKIVVGVNDTLDAVIGPLNVAADYVNNISQGNIPAKITDTYNGDFNVLKNNLNTCIDAVNALVSDANILSVAAVEGRLATRADATKHQGDFRKIVVGVNDTLDAVIGPLNVAADYVDKISQGNTPTKITDTYNGDFNVLKNNLNTCIDAVNALVSDANILSVAAVEGRLATRADATKHQGDFRKIVVGVNDTLDAVIGPLNVAADYVDKISQGNIPAKITDTYNGDFNVLKNNLNTCIDAVNALVSDANILSIAAVEGRLATRADATKHQGDFRKIVVGVNDTLDAVIGPLNVAADYVDKISIGNIPTKITDTYNGDFNVLKNNLNTCIDAVNALVSDANILSVAAVEGKLATRADATKHQGDFRKIVVGVNDTLDAVIGPLNVAADYVDKISQGNTPAKITDTYNGDFNVLKNNLNTCIDAINQQAAAAKGIAAGDFSVKVDVRSENDELSKSLIQVTNVLKALQDEMQRLTVASNEGLLSERGKPEKFQGEYAAVVNGVNNMLDAILLPIGEGNRILSLICGGDLRQKVEVACQGDHDKMKQAINGVHGWLSDLVAYVTKIANGDMTAEMAKASNDDQIHEYLILMRESIKSLVSDATLLSVAAVEGKLATRADATKHQGDFRKIVVGVNDTLDAVIGPLNVAADYVDKISQGNIPAKITDTYNGDFNVLKNNLNTCIDAVNALVSDANILSMAAVEGKLATRADATKHQGDFRKIVVGVNDTLDAVIGPLNVAANYVDNIAQGNIPAKITDTYNGDFNVLKNNLNTCIDAVNFIIEDASMMSNAIVDGNLAIMVNADRHQGDYRKIIDAFESALVGLNDTFYQINDTIKQVAESATQLSASAQNMASNSEEQSSAVEEITSALEETDSQVKANTENANSANQLVMITSDAANQGQTKMQAMSVAMSSINDSAQSIAKIIKVIDEIAFQTNLLALNAAVEAARAGQHGRGFAVVAQEVRNLAGRSAKAARETADLIEDSTKRVSDGVNIAAETGEALDKIVTNVTKVKNLVSEISTASMEQSRGVSQINIAMGQVASAAREGSLQSEEQALSSTGLTAVASRTQQELSRFKLRSRQRSSGLLSLDGITPDVLRQLQAMLAQQNASAAPNVAPAKAPAKAAPVAAPVKKSPKQVMPLDSDERGFGEF
jgi:methyl-accepting chemotaxis protein